ncbi:Retrovirus-related Pol polyprotein from transposon TNT 1-94 [Senna tora]|uniref:Retrovirus-related Pol polyprotein from transposon TNT 1-94 n=1 Tax=Senna tora TaxID=362788 RepID=A0A834TFI7_9FABA|nr:Retrovirus-related Pol polyprotein from transposon TNT 1-94 [Senna tora]
MNDQERASKAFDMSSFTIIHPFLALEVCIECIVSWAVMKRSDVCFPFWKAPWNGEIRQRFALPQDCGISPEDERKNWMDILFSFQRNLMPPANPIASTLYACSKPKVEIAPSALSPLSIVSVRITASGCDTGVGGWVIEDNGMTSSGVGLAGDGGGAGGVLSGDEGPCVGLAGVKAGGWEVLKVLGSRDRGKGAGLPSDNDCNDEFGGERSEEMLCWVLDGVWKANGKKWGIHCLTKIGFVPKNHGVDVSSLSLSSGSRISLKLETRLFDMPIHMTVVTIFHIFLLFGLPSLGSFISATFCHHSHLCSFSRSPPSIIQVDFSLSFQLDRHIICLVHNRCIFHNGIVDLAYKVYDMENKKLYISRDSVFYEEIFPFHEKIKLPDPVPQINVPENSDVDPSEIPQAQSNTQQQSLETEVDVLDETGSTDNS